MAETMTSPTNTDKPQPAQAAARAVPYLATVVVPALVSAFVTLLTGPSSGWMMLAPIAIAIGAGAVFATKGRSWVRHHRGRLIAVVLLFVVSTAVSFTALPRWVSAASYDARNPETAGCGPQGAQSVDEWPVTAADGTVVAQAQLMHSAHCGTFWARVTTTSPTFSATKSVSREPSFLLPGADAGPVTDGATSQPTFGLQVFADRCVHLDVRISDGAGEVARLTEGCAGY